MHNTKIFTKRGNYVISQGKKIGKPFNQEPDSCNS